MPKIVDAQGRRHEVVEAVLRIAQRDGLEQASLRNIATEAGLAIGSVRHYFTDHAEVMSVAMRVLADRLTTRILRRAAAITGAEVDKREAVEALLEEFLPFDDLRRLECTAWLSFINAARTMPRLHPYAATMHTGTRQVMRKVVDGLRQSGHVSQILDPHLETERLASLLDGLTLGGVLHPDELDITTARAVLRAHLDSLLK